MRDYFADALARAAPPSAADPYEAALQRAAAPEPASEWEDVTPILQRRKKASGKGYDYRPKPGAIPGGLPAVGKIATPDTSAGAITREGLRLARDAVVENLTSAPEQVELALNVPRVAVRRAATGKSLTDREALGALLEEKRVTAETPLRQASRERYGKSVDRFATATQDLPTPLAAGLYGGIELAAGLADPTNLPSGSAVSRGVARAGGEALEEGLETAGKRTVKKAMGESGGARIAREAASGREAKERMALLNDDDLLRMRDQALKPNKRLRFIEQLQERALPNDPRIEAAQEGLREFYGRWAAERGINLPESLPRPLTISRETAEQAFVDGKKFVAGANAYAPGHIFFVEGARGGGFETALPRDLVHETYHALAPNVEEGGRQLRGFRTPELAARAEKLGVPDVSAIEEGLAVRNEWLASQDFIARLHPEHSAREAEWRQAMRSRGHFADLPDSAVELQPATPDWRAAGWPHAAFPRYAEPARLVEHLIATVPEFEIVAEQFRFRRNPGPLRAAVDSVYGSGTADILLRTPEAEAGDVLRGLQEKGAPRLAGAMAHAGSDVSPEAINRVAQGNRYVRITPGGEVRPIINDVGAVDVRVNPGEVKAVIGPDGRLIVEQGRPNPAQQRALAGIKPEPSAAARAAVDEPDVYDLGEIDPSAEAPRRIDPQSGHIRNPMADPPPMGGEHALARFGSPVVWREVDAQGARELLNLTEWRAPRGSVDVATSRDLALGQGSNRGIMVEMDAAMLTGSERTGKPGLAFSKQEGFGTELTARPPAAYSADGRRDMYARQDFSSAVRAVEFPKKWPSAFDRNVSRNTREQLAEAGWREIDLGDRIRMERDVRPGTRGISPDPEAGRISLGPLTSARDWVVRNFRGGGPQAGQYELAAREFEPGRIGVERLVGRGETPPAGVVRSIPKRIEGLEGRQGVAKQRAQDILDEATPIVQKIAPSKKGQQALWRDMQAAAAGDLPLDQIPEPLRPLVARRQQLTEALQKRGIDTGAFPDDMVEAISKSGGQYHHRTYRAFKDPKHYEKVKDTPDWYAARDYLKNELPNATDGEVQDILLALTKREKGATALTIQQAPTRLNSILRERKNIPPPLRKLMGEELDFRLTTLETVEQLARDIETHNFWKELGEDGLAAGVFRDPDLPAPAGYEGGLWARIPGSNAVEGISSRGPVEGLLTREALRDVIVGQFEPQKITKWNRFAAYVNLGKTVGGFPAGHIRNFAAHHVTSFVNGKEPWLVYRKAPELRRLFKDPAMRSLRDRAIELGVVGDGASSREVFDFIQTIEEGTANPLAIGVAKAGKKLGKSWRAGDSVWRAAHWLDEVEQLAWANPGMSRPAVEAWAADRVLDTFQTYSRAPEIAARLRRTPLGGPGVTFHMESVRNLKNIARTAALDIIAGYKQKNPRMAALGMRRVAGLMTVPAFVASIPTLSRLASGSDRRQQEAMRRQVLPYYLENAEVFTYDFEPGKSVSVVDLSFMNPYSSLSRTSIATYRSMGEANGVPPAAAIGEFLDQVTGGDIATKELLQLVTNESMGSPWELGDRKGSPIYNLDEAPRGLAAVKDAGYHAYRGFAPGGVVQGENLLRGAGVLDNEGQAGRVRNLPEEAVATLGARPSTYDIPKSFRFNLAKKGDRFEEVTREFRKAIPTDPAKIARQADRYLDSWSALYEETKQTVGDYRLLGMEAGAIRSGGAAVRLPGGVLKSALAGNAAPPSPIRLNARGELPESWNTPERRPLALAILRRWRERW